MVKCHLFSGAQGAAGILLICNRLMVVSDKHIFLVMSVRSLLQFSILVLSWQDAFKALSYMRCLVSQAHTSQHLSEVVPSILTSSAVNSWAIRGQLETGETTSLPHCSADTLSILICYKKLQQWSEQPERTFPTSGWVREELMLGFK